MPESFPGIDNFSSRQRSRQNSKNGNEINIKLVYIVDLLLLTNQKREHNNEYYTKR